LGHEAVIYGVIVGASYKVGDDYATLQQRNEDIIRSLKADDDWPWVDRSIFALPGSYPMGTYRRQVIHFGLSIKDEPERDGHENWLDAWLDKFENVLRQLFWSSVRLHVERDFEPKRREYSWIPTEEAEKGLRGDIPRPVTIWERAMQILPGEK
jgi:hypothetical protein